MQTSTLKTTRHALSLATATVVLALAAGLAQTAFAQPFGGPGGPGGPGMGRGGMGFGMGMGMGMDGGLGAPMMSERMLDTVNATAEQRAQIRQIVQAARTDLAAQRDAGIKLREQGRTLFAQPTVDARAAEALRQQALAQHDQASKRMLQAMLDVSRVLTAEQRKTLADRMAQRHAMMERFRAERRALDAPAH